MLANKTCQAGFVTMTLQNVSIACFTKDTINTEGSVFILTLMAKTIALGIPIDVNIVNFFQLRPFYIYISLPYP